MSGIKGINKHESPYEKCEAYGPGSLTDTELLAVLLRTGNVNKNVLQIASEIVGKFDKNKAFLELSRLNINELKKLPGIGKVKSISLSCVFEIGKRLSKTELNNNLKCTSPSVIANNFFEQLRYLNYEEVHLLLLNIKGALIKDIIISKGTVSHSLISTREILINCLKYDAVNLIILHNHPSGDPTPSNDDYEVTNSINEASKIVGLRLLDHIVIGDNKYYSFKENNYI